MKHIAILLSSFLLLVTGLAVAADVPLMTKEELKPLIGSSDVIVLDVRRGTDWSSSEFKIQGAIRAPESEFVEWAKQYASANKLVLYCA